jgi:hypothetical protein
MPSQTSQTPAAKPAAQDVASKETIEINIEEISKKLGIKNKRYP